MKVYTDKTAQEAVIICNADELEQLANACFYTANKWLKQSSSENESWKADLDLQIANGYVEHVGKLESAYKEMSIKKED